MSLNFILAKNERIKQYIKVSVIVFGWEWCQCLMQLD